MIKLLKITLKNINMIFNRNSRTENVLKTSTIGVTCNLINIALGFVYRTYFIMILSASYLGINGLFTNILQMLSLAELGVTSAISYRLYAPIKENDLLQVAKLMTFFKQVYHTIAAAILVFGLMLLPKLEFFINDTNEIPNDINLQVIYLLFLFQTVSSYCFSYKQSLLSADQKQYLLSISQTMICFIGYVLQLISLTLWRSFSLTLTINIANTVCLNYLVSQWVEKKYKSVFSIKTSLDNEEKKKIYSDTKATMLHKVGGTVLNSTDNIILSKFVGLTVLGKYSNYALIITSLNGIMGQLFSSFTSSFGSAHVSLTQDDAFTAYKRVLFVNFWITGWITTSLLVLIDPFISIWLGPHMQLDNTISVVLAIQFYIVSCRKITTSYIDACGLFIKDRYRPLVEALINLVISIMLVKRFGASGVIGGTIISHLLTVFWREPYILFKYEFCIPIKRYWHVYIKFAGVTFSSSLLFISIHQNIFISKSSMMVWVVEGIFYTFLYNAIAVLLFNKTEEFKFFTDLIYSKINTTLKQRGGN